MSLAGHTEVRMLILPVAGYCDRIATYTVQYLRVDTRAGCTGLISQ